MRHSLLLAVLCFSFLCLAYGAEDSSSLQTLNFKTGWRITQDVYDLGEKLRWFDPTTKSPSAGALIASDWQSIPRLVHLQLLLAPQPYFGRQLRYFNQAPWWYRLDFPTPAGSQKAVLRFEGVDYYAKIWLNGKLLGEHEGYAEPFEFEVGSLLKNDSTNALVVKVSSPWDKDITPGAEAQRIFAVKRNMIKGTYEHADTFVQRDVNPIGIWRPVKLLLYDGIREEHQPWIRSSLSDNSQNATVAITWPLWNDGTAQSADFAVRIVSLSDNAVATQASKHIELLAGASAADQTLTISSPRLWSTWDHGTPALYRAELTLIRPGGKVIHHSVDFGIRTIELHRSSQETRFYLNGKPLYLRGTTYWPDVYISNVDRARYQRDIAAALRAGMNALRIHVHTENPEFYEICDRMGVVVLQDFDLNWTFPTDEAFTARAVHLFGSMIQQLRNHPSIIGWIAMNEVFGEANTVRPGPQLVAEAKLLDPTRPTIKSSSLRDDLASGDGHDYRGSLGGGDYTDIFGTTEKLNTEFGVDAPPAAERARFIPEIADKLKDVLPQVSELHDYQYHLLKYYIEHYRIQKYSPNSGYFQFMFIDFCPQSFYGVYDYWGAPKVEGLGGGLRALEESNQPIGIFMEYKDTPVALHAVNDSLQDLGDVIAQWRVTPGNGELVTQGTHHIRLGPDSHVRIDELSFPVKPDQAYQVTLDLFSHDGRVLAHNIYIDPFHHPRRPKGFPDRMDHELGLRLWWAGMPE